MNCCLGIGKSSKTWRQARREDQKDVGLGGWLRDECLNETLFTSMAQARAVLAAWRQDYNNVRPHSKLGGLTPAEIAGQRGWGHAPIPVAITSTISHQSRGLAV